MQDGEPLLDSVGPQKSKNLFADATVPSFFRLVNKINDDDDDDVMLC